MSDRFIAVHVYEIRSERMAIDINVYVYEIKSEPMAVDINAYFGARVDCRANAAFRSARANPGVSHRIEPRKTAFVVQVAHARRNDHVARDLCQGVVLVGIRLGCAVVTRYNG